MVLPKRLVVSGGGGDRIYECIPDELVVRVQAEADELPAGEHEGFMILGRCGDRLIHVRLTGGRPVGEQFGAAYDRAFEVLRDVESGLRVVPTDELTVVFRPSCSRESSLQLLASLGLTVSRHSPFFPQRYIVRVPGVGSAAEVFDLAGRLRSIPDVDSATPNLITEFRREYV